MSDLESIDLESIREWASSEDDVRNTDFSLINEALQFLIAEVDALHKAGKCPNPKARHFA